MTLARSRMIRDAVEVCAIVIAGVWAFYVFVYQNVLVPSFANPTPTFTVQMRHVGNDGPFAVVRIDETIHNIGTVPVHVLAKLVTVLGTEVAARPPGAQPPPASGEFSAYSQFSAPKVVYENTIVTHLGDPKQGAEILLEPGTQTEFALEFYVPRDLGFSAPGGVARCGIRHQRCAHDPNHDQDFADRRTRLRLDDGRRVSDGQTRSRTRSEGRMSKAHAV